MQFTDNEFNSSLGCYIKFIHGNPEQKIEKIYSFSAFQNFDRLKGYVKEEPYQKYAEYLDISIMSIIENSTDWFIRLYIDESLLSDLNPDQFIWGLKLERFKIPRVQIVCIKFNRYYNIAYNNHHGFVAVMFRYLALFDPNLSIILLRDIDNIWTEQHEYFVNKWIERGDDVCLFLNQNYKRQQLIGLTENDVILEDKYYTSILSGIWSIRKNMGTSFPITIWHKLFGYIESYTDFVYNANYIQYKYYGNRFSYGFDEISLSRIAIPIFIQMGLTFYCIPIRIYDVEYFKKLFEEPVLNKFIRNLSDTVTLNTVKDILITKYWDLSSKTAGLSQHILCLMTNIYFSLITGKSAVYKNQTFINNIKTRVYPNPILMGVGLFTFKNYQKYNWYTMIIDNKTKLGGESAMNKFLVGTKLTIDDFTANTQWQPDGPDDNPDDDNDTYMI
jgi:hypothetical protein